MPSWLVRGELHRRTGHSSIPPGSAPDLSAGAHFDVLRFAHIEGILVRRSTASVRKYRAPIDPLGKGQHIAANVGQCHLVSDTVNESTTITRDHAD